MGYCSDPPSFIFEYMACSKPSAAPSDRPSWRSNGTCLPGGNSGGAVPGEDAQFMAYLRTITRASRNFDGTVWASYDMAYRRQAANQHSLDWGIIDSALYNEAFMGRARLISRCRFCLADSHDSRECCFGLEERSPPARAPYTSTHRDQKSVQICKPGGNACM